MDLPLAIGRNSRVPTDAFLQPLEIPPPPAAAAPAEALMVDVVVLSGDLELYDAIRHSVGERNPVWRARSAAESVDLLLTGRCGVLLLDLAAVSSQPATLVEQIVDQFPDVVVVVAGQRDDEHVLAGLVSDGLVYRFMHKPLSPRRAGMFLNAAMHAHLERRAGRAGKPLLPLVGELRWRVDLRKWLFVASGLAVFIACLAALLVARYGHPPGAGLTADGPVARPAAIAPVAAPLADPVLSRARAAFAAGRYAAPPGRNALDLFAAVLDTRPGDAEARDGLATTIRRLLEQARRAERAGNAAEARRIAERVIAVRPQHAGARQLLARLTAVPEPVLAAPSLPAQGRTPEPTGAVAQSSAAAAIPVAAAATPPSREVATPSPKPAAIARVQPDPLTPRIIGNGALPTSPGRRSPAAARRQYGAPANLGHAIAGYAQRRPEPAVVTAAAPLPDRDLEPVATPAPLYPAAAFSDGVEGWVEIDYTITEQGAVRDVEVVNAEPRGVFEAAATAAVAAWRYRPRVVNGRPVMQRSTVTLHFNVVD